MPELHGPRGPIPYHRGPFGYPRFRARDFDEAAWARGWFHAQDRLLQVQLTLLAGRGRLMELVGDVPFARLVDRMSRSLGLARRLKEDAIRFDDAGRNTLEAYCAGFNAGRRERGTPLLAQAAGLEIRDHDLETILLLMRTASWFGLASLTQVAKLATAQLTVGGASPRLMQLLLGDGAADLDHDAATGVTWPEAHSFPGLPITRGSNAFAVAADHSTTGGALLMSEFHMEIARFPPIVHFSSATLPDGDYVQGISIPGLPIVSAGRTRRIAWGYTFGHADQIDVTIENCQRGKRQVGDAWRPLERRRETVNIRGGNSEAWDFFDFGSATILGDAGAPEETRLPAQRWRGLHEVAVDLGVFIRQPLMKSVDELVEEHRRVRCISVAGTFADADGQVGWIQTGRVGAERAGWGPTPGGRSDEGDDIPESERPVTIGPDRGFIASCNEAAGVFTAFPETSYRHDRLVELLSRPGKRSPEDMIAASYDTRSGSAARLVPVWAPLLPDDADGRRLAAWPGDGDDRRASALFHALHHALCHALVEGASDASIATFVVDDSGMLISIQENLDAVLALEVPELLDEAALKTLIARVWPRAQAKADAGDVPGPVTTPFKNVVTQGKLPGILGFSSAPQELPGSPDALFASRRTVLGGETVITGPSFHLLVDMARPGVRLNVPGGASERRLGPGYGTGVEAWRTGQFITVEPECA